MRRPSDTRTGRLASLLLLGLLPLHLGPTDRAAAAGPAFGFSYSGRLTEPNGRPVAGPVALSVSFYRTASGGSPVLTVTEGLNAVPLQEGIFQISLTLSGSDFHTAFPSVTDAVYVEITDLTHRPAAPYERQLVAMVPFAAKVPVDDVTLEFNSQGELTLKASPTSGASAITAINAATAGTIAPARLPAIGGDVTGALDAAVVGKLQGRPLATTAPASGDYLKWNGTAWEPAALAGAAGGTVTSVATGKGLSGGPITVAGTIELKLNATGGLSKTLGAGTDELGIADGGVSLAKISNAGTDCDDDGKVLKVAGGVWTCADDATLSEDDARAAVVQDAIVDAVTDHAPSQNAVFDALAGKQATIGAATVLSAASLSTLSQGGLVLSPFGTGAGQTGELRFHELTASGDKYVGFKAPDDVTGASGASVIWTLPAADGSGGQALVTSGTGVLSWASISTTSGSETLTNKTINADNNTLSNIANAHIKAGAAIDRAKLASGTADHIVVNSGTGALSSVAQLDVARGGTGATDAATARTNLGVAASGANSDITSLSGLSTALSVAQGGSGANNAADARTNLGAAAAGANGDITSLTGLTTALSVAQGGSGANNAADARTNLGAAASGANGDITSLTGLTTALSIAQGGTGATSAEAASRNMLPTQTSQSGKYLTTDGTDAFWSTVSPTVSSLAASDGTPAQALAVDADGKVGIGVLAPDSVLNVAGAPKAFYSGSYLLNVINDTTAYNAAPQAGLTFSTRYSSNPLVDPYPASGLVGGKENATNNNSLGYLGFFTYGSDQYRERMRIASDGNVGIGTATPRAPLELYSAKQPTPGVDGSSGILIYNPSYDGQFRIGSGVNANALWTVGTGSTGTHAPDDFYLWKEAGTTGAKLVVKDNGNVGIGTTSPTERLVIGADLGEIGTGTMVAIGQAGNSSGIAMGEDNDNYGRMSWDDGTNILNFRTRSGGTSYLNTLVLKDGNVGLGTTAPLSPLTIQGGTAAGTPNTNNGMLLLGHDNSANGGRMILEFGRTTTATNGATWLQSALTGNNAQPFALNPAGGNVGIGTTDPASHLHLNRSTNGPTILTIDAGSAQAARQADLDLVTLGNGALLLGNVATKGWKLSAYGDNHGTASAQNDLALRYWDGSSWADRLVLDSATSQMTVTGSVNATTSLCINGDCKTAWPASGGDVTGGGQTGALTIGTNDASPLTLETNDTPRLTVKATGEVGIGTANPLGNLDVRQSANGATTIYAQRQTDTAPTGNFVELKDAAGSTSLFKVGVDGSITGGTGVTSNIGGIQFSGFGSIFTNGTTLNLGASSSAGVKLVPAQVSAVGGTHVDHSAFSGVMAPTAGAATYAGFGVYPTINTTGTFTGSTTALRISQYNQSTTGVASNLLIDAGTNTASGGAGTHTSLFALSNTGRVGIGTQNPSTKLQVVGGDVKIDSGYGIGDPDNALGYVKFGTATTAIHPTSLSTAGLLVGTNRNLYRAGNGGGGIAVHDFDTGAASPANAFPYRFSDAGTPRMVIDYQGQVGIGTGAPAAKLHLYRSTNDPTVLAIDAGGAETARQADLDLLTLSNGTLALGDASTKGWKLSAYGDAFGTAASRNDFALRYWDGTAWADRLVLDSATSQMTVTGSVNATTSLCINGDCKTVWPAGGGDVVNGGQAGALTVGTNDANALTLETDDQPRITIAADGKVGIGKTDPQYVLDIVGDNGFRSTSSNYVAGSVWGGGGSQFRFGSSGAAVIDEGFDIALYAGGAGQTPAFIAVRNTANGGADNYLTFSTVASNLASERMRITHEGKVGIGTIAPAYALSVASTVGIGSQCTTTAAANTGLCVGTAGNSNGFYSLRAGSSSFPQTLVATNAGRVGVGVLAPATQLEVDGALRLSGTGTDTFVTPLAVSLPTKINIPVLNPGAYGQILALGLPAAADDTARVLWMADARTGTHQPTFAVASPDENQVTGFSWEGTNTVASVRSSAAFSIRTNAQVFPTVTGGNEALYVAANGQVGIGTNDPKSPLDVAGNTVRVRTSKTPASSTAACDQGEIVWDANYVYVCVSTNNWKRSALSSW